MKIILANVEMTLMKATVSIFVDLFFEAFKNKTIVKGTTVIEKREKQEALVYCADTLSDDFFFEARKLLIQYYPEKNLGFLMLFVLI